MQRIFLIRKRRITITWSVATVALAGDVRHANKNLMILTLLAAAAFAATMIGGSVALKLRDRLHLILGFSAGAVIAVAFFDLLPESLELAGERYATSAITAFVALGFLLYLLLDRLLVLHGHGHSDDVQEEHGSHHRGHVRAGSLSIHSFLDGVGIGLAFQVSPTVGLIVAAAVLAHDFSDGINTVNVVVRHGGTRTQAMRWLLADAVAPVIGIITASFFVVPAAILGLLLALFCGFFLYIGASDLIPESHHVHPTFWTTFMTLVGAAVLFVAISVAG
ncbi:MAG TPA: ZIP family metal transporter [Candidatus Paceibacterota bacterium]|nr:ZIP family metal transporter [Candidatus Paceibacterota bacterium]